MDQNTQSPTTTDEHLWQAQARIRVLEGRVTALEITLLECERERNKARSLAAALREQLEARND